MSRWLLTSESDEYCGNCAQPFGLHFSIDLKCPTLTTFMHELNGGLGAKVDHRLVPIIKFLNRFGVTTISSGIDESVMVAFTGDDPIVMCNVLFKDLREMTSHLSGVLLELTHTRIAGYMGVIECRPEDLGDISNRLGVWLEMIRK